MASRFLLLLLFFVAEGYAAGPKFTTLRGAYADAFLIGAALNTSMVRGDEPRVAELIASQFSTLTAENDMKWASINSAPGRYDFRSADAYVDFGKSMLWP